jgi:transcriptional regulator with XRE-family HTH domain
MAAKQSSPLLRELARRLKAIREERHLTIQEVYDATGIHVGRVEASALNLTMLTLAALCKHYEVRLAAVVDELETVTEAAK